MPLQGAIHRLVHDGDLSRIDADEAWPDLLERAERASVQGHHILRRGRVLAPAADPLVGVDAHDGALKLSEAPSA